MGCSEPAILAIIKEQFEERVVVITGHLGMAHALAQQEMCSLFFVGVFVCYLNFLKVYACMCNYLQVFVCSC